MIQEMMDSGILSCGINNTNFVVLKILNFLKV